MPPKEHRQFSDAERQLQSKTVTLGWQKRSFNCRVRLPPNSATPEPPRSNVSYFLSQVHQGVTDLSAFLNDFRELSLKA
jgi:hypothetical protein